MVAAFARRNFPNRLQIISAAVHRAHDLKSLPRQNFVSFEFMSLSGSFNGDKTVRMRYLEWLDYSIVYCGKVHVLPSNIEINSLRC